MLIGVIKELETQHFKGNSVGCWASVEVKIRGKWTKIISIYNNTSCLSMSRELEDCFENNTSGGIVLGGDLNARLGTLGAVNPDEERQTCDRVVDEEGENWIEILDTYIMTILNGNTTGDRIGQITRPGNSNQQESILDYAAADPHALEIIEEFKIGDEPISDHFPLELTMDTHIEARKEFITQQLWSPSTKQEFQTKMRNWERQHNWKDLHAKLWEATPKKRIETGTTRKNEWWNTSCQISRNQLRQKLEGVRTGREEYEEYRTLKP